MHHEAGVQYLFIGRLRLLTALHVGKGGGGLGVDDAVIRDTQARPFIPGSSLKGALRSHVETLVHALPEVRTCQTYGSYSQCITTDRNLQREFGRLTNEADRVTFLSQSAHLCDTCSLFGAPYFAAKVRFEDMPVLEPWLERVEVRDGVGIDRDSRTARPLVKFEYEAVPARNDFAFRLWAHNLSPKDAALLAIGLLELIDGNVPVGGKTSRGLGRCRLLLDDIYQLDTRDLAQLHAYLIADKEPRMPRLDPPYPLFLRRLIGEGLGITGEGGHATTSA